MKTTINDNVFIVDFAYSIDRDAKGNFLHRRTTTCRIRMGKANDPEKKLSEAIVTTTARNNPEEEKFSRATGRLVAFRRAMKVLFDGDYIGHPYKASDIGVIAYTRNLHLRLAFIGLNTEDQKTFWEDFRKQCPTSFK